MKRILLSLSFLLCLIAGHAQDPRQLRRERIQTSYMLAFGRAPQESEITYWQGRTDANTIADFVKNHKTYIAQDAGTRTATIRKAYNDALGRNPIQAEINYWSPSNSTYAELMKAHVQWLAGNPVEYEKVIKSSYQFVLGRQPVAGELSFWKSQGILSYLVLIGCHEDWKRRNASTAQKTSGANTIAPASGFVLQVALSPLVTSEARSFSGLVAAGGGNLIAAGGGNVIAAGGGNVIAAGGGNVIAAGGGN